MYATRSRQAKLEPFAVRPGIAERLGLPYMDAPLALCAAALAAFSVFTLSQSTLHDVPGSPNYFVDRQALYAALGIVGMYLLARIDYSRFRELRVGIYTFLCVSISLVFVFGFAARGSRRAFDLPFFSFQPSELGKLLLGACACRVRHRWRQERVEIGSARCATSASAWHRLGSFSYSRTSAPPWCSGQSPSP